MSLLALLAATAPSGPVGPLIPVTATAPTADDTANTITIPTVEHVTYLIDGSPATGTIDVGNVTADVTVIAVGKQGYVVTGDDQWTFTFTASTAPVNLYPGATPQAVPAPIAHWDFREAAAPHYTTAATGADLPLQVGTIKTTEPPLAVDHEDGLRGLYTRGDQYLVLPGALAARLNRGASEGTTVSMAAWVWNAKYGQTFLGGIWGETFDPPTRQYGLFSDLPAYGGPRMACFHASKDGGPTPGKPYSTDYSATPPQATIGRWELHVGTYDGVQLVSYINGVANAHTSAPGSTRAGDGQRNPYTFLDGLNDAEEDFTVAALPDGSSNLYGLIADLRVWDVALTPGQVLTLATEHAPSPPAETAIDWAFTDQVNDEAVTTEEQFSQKQWTVDIGAPAADRVVLVGIAWRPQFSSPAILDSVLIAGAPATVVTTPSADTYAWAYAVVSAGTSTTVDVTWTNREVRWANLTVITLTGADPVHVDSGSGTAGYGVQGATRGGAAFALARTSANNTAWFGYGTKVHESRDNPDDTLGVACAMFPTLDHLTPTMWGQGSVGISTGAVVIAFDPA